MRSSISRRCSWTIFRLAPTRGRIAGAQSDRQSKFLVICIRVRVLGKRPCPTCLKTSVSTNVRYRGAEACVESLERGPNSGIRGKILLAHCVGHAEQSLDSVNPCKNPSLSLDPRRTSQGEVDGLACGNPRLTLSLKFPDGQMSRMTALFSPCSAVCTCQGKPSRS